MLWEIPTALAYICEEELSSSSCSYCRPFVLLGQRSSYMFVCFLHSFFNVHSPNGWNNHFLVTWLKKFYFSLHGFDLSTNFLIKLKLCFASMRDLLRFRMITLPFSTVEQLNLEFMFDSNELNSNWNFNSIRVWRLVDDS